MSHSIEYASQHGIGILTLNAPQRHNALRSADLTALMDQLRECQSDTQLRVLVIRGAGNKTFCAGAALDEMGTGELDQKVFDQAMTMLAELPMPTLAALNGSAYGGGVELALCCDFRIAVDSVRMFVPPAKLGLCYPAGGLRRYVERLGLNTAKRFLLGFETFHAEEILRLGIVDRLVSANELDATVRQQAEHIAALGPLAVQGMKAILNGFANGSMTEQQAWQIKRECDQSDDLREGLAAHREGRIAKFNGR